MTTIKTNDRVRVLRPTWNGQSFEDLPGTVVYHVVGVEDDTAWIETRAVGAVRFPREIALSELVAA